jgi:hypothetical protein
LEETGGHRWRQRDDDAAAWSLGIDKDEREDDNTRPSILRGSQCRYDIVSRG